MAALDAELTALRTRTTNNVAQRVLLQLDNEQDIQSEPEVAVNQVAEARPLLAASSQGVCGFRCDLHAYKWIFILATGR